MHTPERFQRILLGLGIFFAALSIGFSTGPEGTQWFWQKVPYLAMVLLILSFFLVKGWVQLEIQRQRTVILKSLSDQQEDSKEDLYRLLSRREKEVIQLVLEGKRNQEIADQLFIALSTVKSHINNIYKILEVQNRRQAIAKLEAMRERNRGNKGIRLCVKNSIFMLTIRQATLDDLAEIADLLLRVWQKSYRDFLPASFLASLSLEKQIQRHRRYMEGRASYFMCENAQQELIGFTSVGQARGDSLSANWELYTLYVDNAYHGQGIGSQLLEAVLEEIERQAIAVVVMEKNPYRRFYEKHGFLPVSKEEMDLGETIVMNMIYVKR